MPVPTALDVEVDREEYSRFEEEYDSVGVFVTPSGTNVSGEKVKLEFIKARRNRDVVVAEKEVTLSSADTEHEFSFDLNRLRDSDDIPQARRGDYFVRATAVNDANVASDSEDFRLSLVTVDRLRNEFTHGVDGRATEVLGVHEQPQKVTGVEVTAVSRGHPQAWFPLTYSVVEDENGTVQSRTLSWCNGPAVSVEKGKKRYTLRKGRDSDYIDVRVRSISSLPSGPTTEELLVERAPLTDERIRQMVDQAASWVEDVAVDIYLEPTRIMTIPQGHTISFNDGSTIPVFENADWDELVDAITYYVPSPGHWISIKMPHRPFLKFNELFGQVANTRILDVDLQWIEASEKGGFIQLVPFNQEVAFNFIGLVWVESLRGPVPLPNFWNFDAVVGFKRTPNVLLELVAKAAAIDVLTIAGQAFRGGFASQSVSRDGVSESVSYTASAIYGIYSATIEDYRKWISSELKNLRGAFHGGDMIVL